MLYMGNHQLCDKQCTEKLAHINWNELVGTGIVVVWDLYYCDCIWIRKKIKTYVYDISDCLFSAYIFFYLADQCRQVYFERIAGFYAGRRLDGKT